MINGEIGEREEISLLGKLQAHFVLNRFDIITVRDEKSLISANFKRCFYSKGKARQLRLEIATFKSKNCEH